MYNHNKLRGKIKEVFGSEYVFAKKIGLSQTTFSSKLNNKVDFTRSEMIKIAELLKINQNEFYDLFFLKN